MKKCKNSNKEKQGLCCVLKWKSAVYLHSLRKLPNQHHQGTRLVMNAEDNKCIPSIYSLLEVTLRKIRPIKKKRKSGILMLANSLSPPRRHSGNPFNSNECRLGKFRKQKKKLLKEVRVWISSSRMGKGLRKPKLNLGGVNKSRCSERFQQRGQVSCSFQAFYPTFQSSYICPGAFLQANLT